MVGVYIALGILLLFVVLLLLPVKVKLVLEHDGYFMVRYLFFKYKLDFKDKGEVVHTEKKVKHAGKEVKEGYFEQLVRENGILNAVSEILNIIGIVFKKLMILLKHAKVSRLSLYIRAGTGDAAETAIAYGGICAAVYSAVAFINGLLPVKKQEIMINADYERPVFDFSFTSVLSVRLYHVVAAGISFLFRFFKMKLEQKNKDGAKNG